MSGPPGATLRRRAGRVGRVLAGLGAAGLLVSSCSAGTSAFESCVEHSVEEGVDRAAAEAACEDVAED